MANKIPKKFPCTVTAVYAGLYRNKYVDPGKIFTCEKKEWYRPSWMIPGKGVASEAEAAVTQLQTLKGLQDSRKGEASKDDQGAADSGPEAAEQPPI